MPFLRTSTGHMLQIDDLLQLAGQEKLDGFPWGSAVCDELNQYLSKERQLTTENTGNEVIAKIRALPITVLVRLSNLYVNPKTSEISYRDEQDDSCDEDENAPPHHVPREESTRRRDDDEDRDDRDRDRSAEKRPVKDEEQTLHGKIMIMVASTVVIIALILTFNVIKPENRGKEIKSSTLEVALQVLGEVFGATANNSGNNDSGDNSSDDSRRNSSDSDDRPVNRPPRSDDPGPSYGN